MIRVISAAICVLMPFIAAGQSQGKQSVLLLDGSRISGTIVADSSDYFDIKVTTPQIIRIRKSQVSSLEALNYPVKKNLKTEGYYIHFSTSILAGKSENGNKSNLSFHLSNGYQFSNGFSIGIGSGIEELGVAVVPLYADFRFTPQKSRISPYAWLKSGYGFATSDQETIYDYYSAMGGESTGGFLFNAGAGLAMYTWNRTAINIGIGYRYQKITISNEQYWWGGSTVRETVTHYNRIEIQLGFIFR